MCEKLLLSLKVIQIICIVNHFKSSRKFVTCTMNSKTNESSAIIMKEQVNF